MPDIAGLLEVGPFVGDTSETVRMRYCDLCGASPVDDAPGPWRTYYYDPSEGLSVCENCVEGYLSGKPG